jgi:hypothetical protein
MNQLLKSNITFFVVCVFNLQFEKSVFKAKLCMPLVGTIRKYGALYVLMILNKHSSFSERENGFVTT